MSKSTPGATTSRSVNSVAKVLVWLTANKDKAQRLTRAQVQRDIKKELNIDVSPHTIAQVEESLGIERVRGNANSEARKDRLHVIAVALAEFMGTFGYAIPDDLKDIVDRK